MRTRARAQPPRMHGAGDGAPLTGRPVLRHARDPHGRDRRPGDPRCPSGSRCRVPACSAAASPPASGAAIQTAKVWPGATVAVIGLGGIGLGALQGATIAGANGVIAVDVAPAKLAWATGLRRHRRRRRGRRRPGRGGPRAHRRRASTSRSRRSGRPACVRQAVEMLAYRRHGGRDRRSADAERGARSTGTASDARRTRTRRACSSRDGGDPIPAEDFPQMAGWYLDGRLDLDAMVTREARAHRRRPGRGLPGDARRRGDPDPSWSWIRTTAGSASAAGTVASRRCRRRSDREMNWVWAIGAPLVRGDLACLLPGADRRDRPRPGTGPSILAPNHVSVLDGPAAVGDRRAPHRWRATRNLIALGGLPRADGLDPAAGPADPDPPGHRRHRRARRRRHGGPSRQLRRDLPRGPGQRRRVRGPAAHPIRIHPDRDPVEAPVVPVGIWGTQTVWPRTGLNREALWRRPPLAVVYGEPVVPTPRRDGDGVPGALRDGPAAGGRARAKATPGTAGDRRVTDATRNPWVRRSRTTALREPVDRGLPRRGRAARTGSTGIYGVVHFRDAGGRRRRARRRGPRAAGRPVPLHPGSLLVGDPRGREPASTRTPLEGIAARAGRGDRLPARGTWRELLRFTRVELRDRRGRRGVRRLRPRPRVRPPRTPRSRCRSDGWPFDEALAMVAVRRDPRRDHPGGPASDGPRAGNLTSPIRERPAPRAGLADVRWSRAVSPAPPR